MSTVLLLVIALVAPWTVHLAPPRQRPLALVGVVAVLLLYGIFADNPVTRWEMWAGLVAGILTVVFLSAGVGGGRRPPRNRRRPPRRVDDAYGDLGDQEPTGGI